MLGILMIVLGIWVLKVISSRPQKYPCYVGEIVDIGMRPRSHTKYVAKCPIIVRVIINNQPIVTSTLSTVNCAGGFKSAIEAKKREYVGKCVHVYFDHQAPGRSVIKEYQEEHKAGGVILIVVGIISMLVEILMTVVFLWGIV